MRCVALLTFLCLAAGLAPAAELIPRAAGLLKDRPRLFLRPHDTPLAVSLRQLRSGPQDAEYRTLLNQLRDLKSNAACQALVYLLTGDEPAAELAVGRLRAWNAPQGKSSSDPFRVYFGCLEMALAYDWLHAYPGFSAAAKYDLRNRVFPLADAGCRHGEDHVFHNYVWMWNSGAMLWALAALGDDPRCDRLFEVLRDRFNRQLFSAMQYLDGEPGDAIGYWSFYCQQPCLQVLLAVQSAFGGDVLGMLRREQGNWLSRQLDNLVFSVTPDMSLVHWGDVVPGRNGTATCDMAGDIDALTWALKSPSGAHLGRWLAGKRGAERFRGDSALFYFLYTRHLDVAPATPPLAMLAGARHGGQLLARSGWDDGATLVGLRATDFYGQHHHLDQGSFVIHRNGPLALDTGRYLRVGGPQKETACHNTLLLAGEGQRLQRFQSAATLDGFLARLPRGLETGDILFYRDTPEWVAVAAQFGQAYRPDQVKSCVRQLLFVRPGTVVIVDRLVAPEGSVLPEVQWLLHVPEKPQVDEGGVVASNGRSWIRCRSLMPAGVRPRVEEGLGTPGRWSADGRAQTIATYRVIDGYPAGQGLLLAHVLDVGDGLRPTAASVPKIEQDGQAVTLRLGVKTYVFSASPEFSVSSP
jgi:hypothetical protein